MRSESNNDPPFVRFRSHACPVAVFERLYRHEPYAFFYESLEHGERGRYSFMGGRPHTVFLSRNENLYVTTRSRTARSTGNPIAALRRLVNIRRRPAPVRPFSGGAVGYFGYDMVRFFERVPERKRCAGDPPDSYFIFPSEILVFDHQKSTVEVIQHSPDAKRSGSIASAIESACESTPLPGAPRPLAYAGDLTRDQFCRMVARAQEYILAGDIFQVVLSQRLETATDSEPFDVYRSLRTANPSPYMYYLKLGGLSVLGSSPETLVKLQDGTAFSRPIAGTRPRGRTPAQDRRLEADLLGDDKELAEHAMLVDLARNDLGRVCTCGSVRLHDHLRIERFSRVMHMVSNVSGRLAPKLDAFDLLAASFPAGTVSGAPKIRAMEIINELEPVRRGIYAGAIGYFGNDGSTDLCIAIRTIIMDKKRALIQAGAGIVHDSVPGREYDETMNKLSALRMALEAA